MSKKVLLAGVLGAVVLIVWTFVANAVFGFRSTIDMKRVPDERRVYEVLKATIVEPGRYVCNPEPTSAGAFPLNEPVFGIEYAGFGHEAAGWEQQIHLLVFLITPMLAAWMLAGTSPRILSSYSRKMLFFAGIGFLFAIYGDLMKCGIGGYPLKDALALAAYDIVTWTLVGLVVAWRITPGPGTETSAK